MVTGLLVARDAGCRGDSVRRHGEGELLAALGRHANERAVDQVAQPPAG